MGSTSRGTSTHLLWMGAITASLGCLLAGCKGEGDDTADPMRISSAFEVRGTIEQVYVWGAAPDSSIQLESAELGFSETGTADYQGSLVFRELPPSHDYQVFPADDPADFAGPLNVMSVEGSLPDDSLYEEQELVHGYQYLTMRDGTQLSAFVFLPGPVEDGPYPTIVNYSGYSPSQPGQPMSDDLDYLCDSYPVLCDAPSHGAGILGGVMGYASVGVNMRGTGCSGGAYDYFEPLQLTDGYDIIEIVARQDWVLHNQVGMAGLSFPGISQLFVGAQQPPGLAAIAPLSVLADSATSVMAPGGIYNLGFALAWVENVLDRAEPYGHQWIQDLVDEGDTVCEENQLLHSQLLDVVQKAYDNPYYTDEIAKPLDPSSFVDQVQVPVFLGGQWQDEQTGPHFAALLDKFDSAPSTHFLVSNGLHNDGYTGQYMMEWKTFLDFYVARQLPDVDAAVRLLGPMFFEMMYGAAVDVGPNRFEDYTDFDQALADYEAEPSLRVIFETGADPEVDPGAPQGTFQQTFDAWPVPETVARRWYFQPDGSLGDEPPGSDGGASAFEHDPDAGERGIIADGSGTYDLQPDFAYRQPEPGDAVVFVSEPLEETLVMVGHGSVDLWLQSTADDADLEVTLSELRPDGLESKVQSGWLRASHRALREDATELRPVKSHYEEDAAPLVAGEWNEVRVEIMPFAHVFRAGSRIRLAVDTPGDSCADWTFILQEFDTDPTHSIAHEEAYPSSVVLPVVPGVEVPTEMPDAAALRGQAWREFVEYENEPG